MSEPALTAFQERMLAALAKFPNQHASTTDLAARMRSSRVAVVSAGRALERAGRVVSWRHGNDEWAVLMWAPRRER